MHVGSIAHLYKAKCNIKYLSACIFHIFFIVYYADKFQDSYRMNTFNVE